MKLTTRQLRSIISEEVKKALTEAPIGTVDLTGVKLNSKSGPIVVNNAYVESMDPSFGELRVEFSAMAAARGDYYGDKMLLKNLRSALASQGMSPAAVAEVDFSEAGMQGAGYISLDVGEAFLSEWPEY